MQFNYRSDTVTRPTIGAVYHHVSPNGNPHVSLVTAIYTDNDGREIVVLTCVPTARNGAQSSVHRMGLDAFCHGHNVPTRD